MSTGADNEIPQWKKDLIARLRSQNRRQQQLCAGPPQSSSDAVGRAAQQPVLSSVAFASTNGKSDRVVAGKCDECPTSSPKMVQERVWNWDALESDNCRDNGVCHKNSDSDSSEDLHYGPGIVNKLRNKYLSLALRESNARTRASILPLRKAASLEHILDDIPNGTQAPRGGSRLFQRSNDTGKNATNRYRNTACGSEMKRARSVETISRSQEEHDNDLKPKRESLHEEMLISDKSGSDKPYKIILDDKMLENPPESRTYTQRINRPKRITPIMSEGEKPPVDFVKQTKLIFERRPEQRTKQPQQTGEVAAKVATYKNIIVQAKVNKKPPIKHKPANLANDKSRNVTLRNAKPKVADKIEKEEVKEHAPAKTPPLPSPIPDISRVDFANADSDRGSRNTSLSETPDLIMTSSPISNVASPVFRISTTEDFIKEERRHSASYENNLTDDQLISPIKTKTSPDSLRGDTKTVAINGDSTVTYNFLKSNKSQNHLPTNKNGAPLLQPLKLELNGHNSVEPKRSLKSPPAKKSPPLSPQNAISSPTVTRNSPVLQNNEIASPPEQKPSKETRKAPLSPPPLKTNPQVSPSPSASANKSGLTILELEKNLINTAKTLEQPKGNVIVKSTSEEVIKIQVPKVKKPPREPENNSIVFKFTDRKDVPDYVHNDGLTRVGKIEKPKVGEGGIILLPGASIGESFTDEDEDEIMRSLEAPPSPCDVTFINDNILIDGKSSLSQKSKKSKMSISFVDSGPDVYEYPSESSLIIDETSTSAPSAQMGHTVPSLSGTSSLANYTPKSTEEFQPGVTRSMQAIPSKNEIKDNGIQSETPLVQEAEQPILFSAGTNSDILF